MKKYFLVVLVLFFVSCSNNENVVINENGVSVWDDVVVSSSWDVMVSSNSGETIDTKALEEELSKDLEDVLNLIPTEE